MLKTVMTGLALVALSAAGLTAQDATLEDVLQCHYESIGGEEAWAALEGVRMTGRLTLGPGMEAPFTVLNVRPNRMRMDFTVQGMTGTQVFDGETGWQVMPFMGSSEPQDMPAEQLEAMRAEADLDGPFVGWQEDDRTLELLEMGEVDGTPAYRIRVSQEGGPEQVYSLDADYCVPIRVEVQQEMQGQTVRIVTTVGDYKDVDGLMIAHSIETRLEGAPMGQAMTVDSVELNPEYDAAIFDRPAGGGDGGDDGGSRPH